MNIYQTSLSDEKAFQFASDLHESIMLKVAEWEHLKSRLFVLVPTMTGLGVNEIILPVAPTAHDAELLFEMLNQDDPAPILGIGLVMEGWYKVREQTESFVLPSLAPNRGECYHIVFCPMDERIYSSFIPFQSEGGRYSIILDDVIPTTKARRIIEAPNPADIVTEKGVVYNRILNLFIDAALKVVYHAPDN